MYWTVSKFIIVAILSTLIFSCSDEEKPVAKDQPKKETLSFEEKIARQVEADLNIPATEKYDLKIKEDYIDTDTIKDALILVNREEWAYKRMESAQNESFMEKTGFVGPYNYVFVKLGNKDDLLKAPPVGSAAYDKLDSKFLTLTSQAQKDFYVNYRIRNSQHRNYYTVRNDRLYLTFSCPVFDSIGEPKPRVFAIKHPESSVRIANDIAVYDGKIVGYDPENIEDPNRYVPEQIIPMKDLYVYFIFDEKSMKYKTPMVPKEKN
tara:strand:- start:27794 stop:28585 length:792 start_codon:yes stop_codon:yes gene_type:complete